VRITTLVKVVRCDFELAFKLLWLCSVLLHLLEFPDLRQQVQNQTG